MNTQLEKEEEIARDFIFNEFVPALHDVFRTANPDAYYAWGQNCCRQAAVFGTVYLKELLPNYKWYAYDGEFKDLINGKEVYYNHAWIFGVDREKHRRLFVDPSRKIQEQLFFVTDENKYPIDHPDYKYTVIVKSYKMNLKARLKDLEYFTKLGARKVLKLVDEAISKRKAQIENE